MYYILFTNRANINIWELVSGEDAMQQRVDEIVRTQGLDPDDVVVINADGEMLE